MAWKIEIERQAEKELNRLDRVAAKRIIAFLVTLGGCPRIEVFSQVEAFFENERRHIADILSIVFKK